MNACKLGLCIGQHQPIQYISAIQQADTIQMDDTSITHSNNAGAHYTSIFLQKYQNPQLFNANYVCTRDFDAWVHQF